MEHNLDRKDPELWFVLATPALVTLLTSMIISWAWYATRTHDMEHSRELVATSLDHTRLRVEGFMRSRQLLFESMADLYSQSPPSNDGFLATARSVHEQFDGLLAINKISKEGVIVLVHPSQTNHKALGKRLRDHKTAWPHYRDARQTGQMHATPPLTLFQGMRGFAVYFPFAHQGQHTGTINVVFDLDKITHRILHDSIFKDYDVRITDDGMEILRTPNFDHSSPYHTVTKAQVMGRTWNIEFSPRPELFRALHNKEIRWGLLGLVFSFLMGVITFFFQDRQRQRILALQLQHDTNVRLHTAHKLESMGLLARGIIHDFNNLMNSITGNAELLLDANLDENDKVCVENILQTSARAVSLTQQLMAFADPSNVEAKGVTQLDTFVQSWRPFLQGLIPPDIRLYLEEGPPTRVKMNDSSLARVLTNLVVNAVDAVEESKGAVQIRWEVESDHVRLTVEDTGVGMSQEVQAQIFEPYFTTKDGDDGTGLGLPTTHGIIQAIGGSIEVHSMPNQGTSFIICLPKA